MCDADKLYYTNASLQLEINLYNVKKELLSMLDDYEQTLCPDCITLKCFCKQPDSDKKKKDEKQEVNGDNSLVKPSRDLVLEKEGAPKELNSKEEKILLQNLQYMNKLKAKNGAVDIFFKYFKPGNSSFVPPNIAAYRTAVKNDYTYF